MPSSHSHARSTFSRVFGDNRVAVQDSANAHRSRFAVQGGCIGNALGGQKSGQLGFGVTKAVGRGQLGKGESWVAGLAHGKG